MDWYYRLTFRPLHFDKTARYTFEAKLLTTLTTTVNVLPMTKRCCLTRSTGLLQQLITFSTFCKHKNIFLKNFASSNLKNIMKRNFWPILNSNSIPQSSSENCLSISHAEIVMKIVIRYTYSLLIPLPADDQYFKHLFFSFSKLTLLYLLHFIQDGNQVWCTCSV